MTQEILLPLQFFLLFFEEKNPCGESLYLNLSKLKQFINSIYNSNSTENATDDDSSKIEHSLQNECSRRDDIPHSFDS